MHNQRPRAGNQMRRRQLVKQQKQKKQQQQANRFLSVGRELPAKQDQTQHNPAAEALQRESCTSDQ
jgi:hypothetical protein